MHKILPAFFLILFISCQKKETVHPYTFYYWKTNLFLDSQESAALKKATVPYLYVRFFDVDKIGGKFQPVATLTKNENFKSEKQIVPVIFIMNRAFINIKNEEIQFLAKSVNDLINKKNTEFGFPSSKEIQIDCDWTAGTRDDYFKFLKALKEISKKEITSTLRLHQVKDKKVMGIPPVPKVYLMCYSTSLPLENSDRNSILDVKLLKNYLKNIEEYPIKNIDVALPIYSWGIVTNHLGKHRIINALNENDLQNSDFLKISDTEAIVLKDGFYFGNYLNKGFKIKIEKIDNEQLDDVTNFLNDKISHYNIVYYQLDKSFLPHQNFTR